MITKPQRTQTLLPSLLLAACVALPAGAAAQTAPPTTEANALGTAMAQALQSPFHATAGVERLTIVGPVPVPVRRAGDQQAPASAGGPSFHRVFWPTLAATYLSDVAFLYALIHCDADSGGGGCSEGERLGTLLLGSTVLVLGPPTAAMLGGGSFKKGVLGSAAGLAAGAALFGMGMAVGLDDSIAGWAIPAAHVLLTTSFGIG